MTSPEDLVFERVATLRTRLQEVELAKHLISLGIDSYSYKDTSFYMPKSALVSAQISFCVGSDGRDWMGYSKWLIWSITFEVLKMTDELNHIKQPHIRSKIVISGRKAPFNSKGVREEESESYLLCRLPRFYFNGKNGVEEFLPSINVLISKTLDDLMGVHSLDSFLGIYARAFASKS
ncbi:hypothetical protein [Deinococcus aquatilis]|jgi:hypothetical protein|uniref:hypothetical protein n=1 Tax=Deinococcus aquatilis TaxID=519440 RepID=UPI0012F75E20|nr:hypothetical protein [Deinococcus aquatilis]